MIKEIVQSSNSNLNKFKALKNLSQTEEFIKIMIRPEENLKEFIDFIIEEIFISNEIIINEENEEHYNFPIEFLLKFNYKNFSNNKLLNLIYKILEINFNIGPSEKVYDLTIKLKIKVIFLLNNLIESNLEYKTINHFIKLSNLINYLPVNKEIIRKFNNDIKNQFQLNNLVEVEKKTVFNSINNINHMNFYIVSETLKYFIKLNLKINFDNSISENIIRNICFKIENYFGINGYIDSIKINRRVILEYINFAIIFLNFININKKNDIINNIIINLCHSIIHLIPTNAFILRMEFTDVMKKLYLNNKEIFFNIDIYYSRTIFNASDFDPIKINQLDFLINILNNKNINKNTILEFDKRITEMVMSLNKENDYFFKKEQIINTSVLVINKCIEAYIENIKSTRNINNYNFKKLIQKQLFNIKIILDYLYSLKNKIIIDNNEDIKIIENSIYKIEIIKYNDILLNLVEFSKLILNSLLLFNISFSNENLLVLKELILFPLRLNIQTEINDYYSLYFKLNENDINFLIKEVVLEILIKYYDKKDIWIVLTNNFNIDMIFCLYANKLIYEDFVFRKYKEYNFYKKIFPVACHFFSFDKKIYKEVYSQYFPIILEHMILFNENSILSIKEVISLLNDMFIYIKTYNNFYTGFFVIYNTFSLLFQELYTLYCIYNDPFYIEVLFNIPISLGLLVSKYNLIKKPMLAGIRLNSKLQYTVLTYLDYMIEFDGNNHFNMLLEDIFELLKNEPKIKYKIMNILNKINKTHRINLRDLKHRHYEQLNYNILNEKLSKNNFTDSLININLGYFLKTFTGKEFYYTLKNNFRFNDYGLIKYNRVLKSYNQNITNEMKEYSKNFLLKKFDQILLNFDNNNKNLLSDIVFSFFLDNSDETLEILKEMARLYILKTSNKIVNLIFLLNFGDAFVYNKERAIILFNYIIDLSPCNSNDILNVLLEYLYLNDDLKKFSILKALSEIINLNLALNKNTAVKILNSIKHILLHINIEKLYVLSLKIIMSILKNPLFIKLTYKTFNIKNNNNIYILNINLKLEQIFNNNISPNLYYYIEYNTLSYNIIAFIDKYIENIDKNDNLKIVNFYNFYESMKRKAIITYYKNIDFDQYTKPVKKYLPSLAVLDGFSNLQSKDAFVNILNRNDKITTDNLSSMLVFRNFLYNTNLSDNIKNSFIELYNRDNNKYIIYSILLNINNYDLYILDFLLNNSIKLYSLSEIKEKIFPKIKLKIEKNDDFLNKITKNLLENIDIMICREFLYNVIDFNEEIGKIILIMLENSKNAIYKITHEIEKNNINNPSSPNKINIINNNLKSIGNIPINNSVNGLPNISINSPINSFTQNSPRLNNYCLNLIDQKFKLSKTTYYLLEYLMNNNMKYNNNMFILQIYKELYFYLQNTNIDSFINYYFNNFNEEEIEILNNINNSLFIINSSIFNKILEINNYRLKLWLLKSVSKILKENQSIDITMLNPIYLNNKIYIDNNIYNKNDIYIENNNIPNNDVNKENNSSFTTLEILTDLYDQVTIKNKNPNQIILKKSGLLLNENYVDEYEISEDSNNKDFYEKIKRRKTKIKRNKKLDSLKIKVLKDYTKNYKNNINLDVLLDIYKESIYLIIDIFIEIKYYSEKVYEKCKILLEGKYNTSTSICNYYLILYLKNKEGSNVNLGDSILFNTCNLSDHDFKYKNKAILSLINNKNIINYIDNLQLNQILLFLNYLETIQIKDEFFKILPYLTNIVLNNIKNTITFKIYKKIIYLFCKIYNYKVKEEKTMILYSEGIRKVFLMYLKYCNTKFLNFEINSKVSFFYDSLVYAKIDYKEIYKNFINRIKDDELQLKLFAKVNRNREKRIIIQDLIKNKDLKEKIPELEKILIFENMHKINKGIEIKERTAFYPLNIINFDDLIDKGNNYKLYNIINIYYEYFNINLLERLFKECNFTLEKEIIKKFKIGIEMYENSTIENMFNVLEIIVENIYYHDFNNFNNEELYLENKIIEKSEKEEESLLIKFKKVVLDSFIKIINRNFPSSERFVDLFNKLILLYSKDIKEILLNNVKDNKISYPPLLESLYKIFYYIDKESSIKLCFRMPMRINDQIVYYNTNHLIKIYPECIEKYHPLLIKAIYDEKMNASTLKALISHIKKKEGKNDLEKAMKFLFTSDYSFSIPEDFNSLRFQNIEIAEVPTTNYIEIKTTQFYFINVLTEIFSINKEEKKRIGFLLRNISDISMSFRNLMEIVLKDINDKDLFFYFFENKTLNLTYFKTKITIKENNTEIEINAKPNKSKNNKIKSINTKINNKYIINNISDTIRSIFIEYLKKDNSNINLLPLDLYFYKCYEDFSAALGILKFTSKIREIKVLCKLILLKQYKLSYTYINIIINKMINKKVSFSVYDTNNIKYLYYKIIIKLSEEDILKDEYINFNHDYYKIKKEECYNISQRNTEEKHSEFRIKGLDSSRGQLAFYTTPVFMPNYQSLNTYSILSSLFSYENPYDMLIYQFLNIFISYFEFIDDFLVDDNKKLYFQYLFDLFYFNSSCIYNLPKCDLLDNLIFYLGIVGELCESIRLLNANNKESIYGRFKMWMNRFPDNDFIVFTKWRLTIFDKSIKIAADNDKKKISALMCKINCLYAESLIAKKKYKKAQVVLNEINNLQIIEVNQNYYKILLDIKCFFLLKEYKKVIQLVGSVNINRYSNEDKSKLYFFVYRSMKILNEGFNEDVPREGSKNCVKGNNSFHKERIVSSQVPPETLLCNSVFTNTTFDSLNYDNLNKLSRSLHLSIDHKKEDQKILKAKIYALIHSITENLSSRFDPQEHNDFSSYISSLSPVLLDELQLSIDEYQLKLIEIINFLSLSDGIEFILDYLSMMNHRPDFVCFCKEESSGKVCCLKVKILNFIFSSLSFHTKANLLDFERVFCILPLLPPEAYDFIKKKNNKINEIENNENTLNDVLYKLCKLKINQKKPFCDHLNFINLNDTFDVDFSLFSLLHVFKNNQFLLINKKIEHLNAVVCFDAFDSFTFNLRFSNNKIMKINFRDNFIKLSLKEFKLKSIKNKREYIVKLMKENKEDKKVNEKIFELNNEVTALLNDVDDINNNLIKNYFICDCVSDVVKYNESRVSSENTLNSIDLTSCFCGCFSDYFDSLIPASINNLCFNDKLAFCADFLCKSLKIKNCVFIKPLNNSYLHNLNAISYSELISKYKSSKNPLKEAFSSFYKKPSDFYAFRKKFIESYSFQICFQVLFNINSRLENNLYINIETGSSYYEKLSVDSSNSKFTFCPLISDVFNYDALNGNLCKSLYFFILDVIENKNVHLILKKFLGVDFLMKTLKNFKSIVNYNNKITDEFDLENKIINFSDNIKIEEIINNFIKE